MGLFDAFTGSSAQDAANKNAALYNNYRSDATTALNSAYGTGINAISGGLNNAVGAVNTGVSNATPYYQQAAQGFAPFAGAGQTGLAGETMLGNAYGLNGQAGTNAAQAAFKAGPGYQWNVDQNLEQVARNQAKLGMANSGNTLTALQDRANGLAQQEYGNWLNGLGTTTQAGLNAGLQGAQGASSALTGLGNINYGAGTTLGNLYNTAGTAQAQLGSNYADSLANVQGAATSGLAGSNTAAANAQTQANSNLWKGLFDLGGNAVKAFAPLPGVGASVAASMPTYQQYGNGNYYPSF